MRSCRCRRLRSAATRVRLLPVHPRFHASLCRPWLVLRGNFHTGCATIYVLYLNFVVSTGMNNAWRLTGGWLALDDESGKVWCRGLTVPTTADELYDALHNILVNIPGPLLRIMVVLAGPYVQPPTVFRSRLSESWEHYAHLDGVYCHGTDNIVNSPLQSWLSLHSCADPDLFLGLLFGRTLYRTKQMDNWELAPALLHAGHGGNDHNTGLTVLGCAGTCAWLSY